MKKFVYGMILIGLTGLFLTGCGSTSPSEVAPVGEVTSGNLGMPGPGSSADPGYAEAVQMKGAKNAEVEASSGIDLPSDALVFTTLENKTNGAYSFSFYSQMEASELQSYLDQQFSSLGYSLKRPWMNFVGSIQSGLYNKGASALSVSLDDRGDHRYVDVMMQN